jgi:hypothetical protein
VVSIKSETDSIYNTKTTLVKTSVTRNAPVPSDWDYVSSHSSADVITVSTCDSGQSPCGEGCMPIGSSCCLDSNYCTNRQYCVPTEKGAYGCCPIGETCEATSQFCAIQGLRSCGGGCIPMTDECCPSETGSCAAGFTCVATSDKIERCCAGSDCSGSTATAANTVRFSSGKTDESSRNDITATYIAVPSATDDPITTATRGSTTTTGTSALIEQSDANDANSLSWSLLSTALIFRLLLDL